MYLQTLTIPLEDNLLKFKFRQCPLSSSTKSENKSFENFFQSISWLDQKNMFKKTTFFIEVLFSYPKLKLDHCHLSKIHHVSCV